MIFLLVGVLLLVMLLLLSRYRFEVRAETLIEASPQKVWDTLVQMGQYENWNDQLHFLGGKVAPGEKITLRLSVEGAKPYTFSPTINHWVKYKKWGWIARTGMPGIFDGEHMFELEEKEGKTLLVNKEQYRGILAPIIQQQPMMKNAPKGFEQMNQQLKTHIEKQNTE